MLRFADYIWTFLTFLAADSETEADVNCDGREGRRGGGGIVD